MATVRIVRLNIGSGGPFEEGAGYSRAVRVGDTVHVAGTTARGDDLEGDAYVQAQAAIEIIRAALEEAGADLADVVRTVMYVTDIADAGLVTRAHAEAFRDIRPAATLVAVAALMDPAMRVEIQVDAVVSGG